MVRVQPGPGESRARVFCMASAKGGSGKTILAATFATFLAHLGKRVLLIDTDAATNGLSLFYLQDVVHRLESADRTLTGLFEYGPGEPPPDLIALAPGFDLLPATYRFKNTETMPLARFGASLREAVRIHHAGYDYIFLDAQAGSDEYAQVAIDPEVSDRVIIVSEYDPISAAGVERLKALFVEELDYGRTWVLLNKMLPEFVTSFRDFMEIARYLSPIPWTGDVVRAYAHRELALDLDNGNDYTVAVAQTLRTLLDPRNREELDSWLDRRTSDLRRSVDELHEQVRAELDELYRRRAALRRRERRPSLLRLGNAAGLVVLAFASIWFVGSGGLPGVVLLVWLAALAVTLTVLTSDWWWADVRSLDRGPGRDEVTRMIAELEARQTRLAVLADLDLEATYAQRDAARSRPRRASRERPD